MREKAVMWINTAILAVFMAFFRLVEAAYGQESFVDEIERSYSVLTTNENEQKFFSILLFVVLGGGATYAVFRGNKKIVHAD
jgi:hypothetical protein